jgi:hypothetical protein
MKDTSGSAPSSPVVKILSLFAWIAALPVFDRKGTS